MDLHIETFATPPLATNTHVLVSGASAAAVDPGMGMDDALAAAGRRGARVEAILLTHGHGDHIAGVGEVKAAHPEARLICPTGDAAMLSDAELNMSAPFGFAITSPPADETIEPGGTVRVGESEWRVLDTSGHTPGGVSYYCREAGVVLTGDALFAAGVGRCDIPRADWGRLLANIRQSLLTLPDETRVLPGHGPETTIGAERRGNPFLV